ncbi:hypothetical protein J2S43_005738 [Catenuloplanes nepalensis]|uniref:Uncharacterized protein n=1 Tax=Catenuloplanes nepalensis TaxID=587533 RepID=A0ABT9N1S9_9ACTN|nr:hypothetical protein [Catenuloplanes nepalensis]
MRRPYGVWCITSQSIMALPERRCTGGAGEKGNSRAGTDGCGLSVRESGSAAESRLLSAKFRGSTAARQSSGAPGPGGRAAVAASATTAANRWPRRRRGGSRGGAEEAAAAAQRRVAAVRWRLGSEVRRRLASGDQQWIRLSSGVEVRCRASSVTGWRIRSHRGSSVRSLVARHATAPNRHPERSATWISVTGDGSGSEAAPTWAWLPAADPAPAGRPECRVAWGSVPGWRIRLHRGSSVRSSVTRHGTGTRPASGTIRHVDLGNRRRVRLRSGPLRDQQRCRLPFGVWSDTRRGSR